MLKLSHLNYPLTAISLLLGASMLALIVVMSFQSTSAAYADQSDFTGNVHDNGNLTNVTINGCSQITAAPNWSVDKKHPNKIKWELTNTGTTKVFLRKVNIGWPSPTNGGIVKGKLNKDWFKPAVPQAPAETAPTLPTNRLTIDETDVSPAVAFTGDLKKRTIDDGKTKKFELEFENNAATGDASFDLLYRIQVSFDQGNAGPCTIVSEFFLETNGGGTSPDVCTTKVQKMTLRYDGPNPLPTVLGATVLINPDKGPDISIGPIDLVDGITEIFVDAVANGENEFGAKTRIQIFDSSNVLVVKGDEKLHTSCSATFEIGQQAPLDGGTVNPPNSSKGDPSPTWHVVSFTQKP